MRLQAHLAVALFSLVAAAACDTMPVDSTGEGIDQESAAIEGQPDILPVPIEYFLAERDARLCPAPGCGGYFVSAPSRPVLHCADGTNQARCYVARIDLSALDLSPTQELSFRHHLDAGVTVLRGTLLGPEVDATFGELVASEGWLPADHNPPHGSFFRLRDTGVRCFTVPCYHYLVSALNLIGSRRVARLDWLLPLPPSAEAVEQLNGNGILVTGSVDFPTPGPVPVSVGAGPAIHVTHHYLRVNPPSIGLDPIDGQ